MVATVRVCRSVLVQQAIIWVVRRTPSAFRSVTVSPIVTTGEMEHASMLEPVSPATGTEVKASAFLPAHVRQDISRAALTVGAADRGFTMAGTDPAFRLDNVPMATKMAATELAC